MKKCAGCKTKKRNDQFPMVTGKPTTYCIECRGRRNARQRCSVCRHISPHAAIDGMCSRCSGIVSGKTSPSDNFRRNADTFPVHKISKVRQIHSGMLERDFREMFIIASFPAAPSSREAAF